MRDLRAAGAAVRWGDWDSLRSVFDAVTVGTVDHWVWRPVQAQVRVHAVMTA